MEASLLRLPLGVGELVLVEFIRVVGTMGPGRRLNHDQYSECEFSVAQHHRYATTVSIACWGRTREIFKQDPLEGTYSGL